MTDEAQPNPHPMACPKCGALRMVDGYCLKCGYREALEETESLGLTELEAETAIEILSSDKPEEEE